MGRAAWPLRLPLFYVGRSNGAAPYVRQGVYTVENYALIAELSCAETGDDCAAQVAWLTVKLRNSAHWLAIQAACEHWEKASEPMRDALAATLGISQPFGDEREPVNPNILEDYKLAQGAARALLHYA